MDLYTALSIMVASIVLFVLYDLQQQIYDMRREFMNSEDRCELINRYESIKGWMDVRILHEKKIQQRIDALENDRHI